MPGTVQACLDGIALTVTNNGEKTPMTACARNAAASENIVLIFREQDPACDVVGRAIALVLLKEIE